MTLRTYRSLDYTKATRPRKTLCIHYSFAWNILESQSGKTTSLWSFRPQFLSTLLRGNNQDHPANPSLSHLWYIIFFCLIYLLSSRNILSLYFFICLGFPGINVNSWGQRPCPSWSLWYTQHLAPEWILSKYMFSEQMDILASFYIYSLATILLNWTISASTISTLFSQTEYLLEYTRRSHRNPGEEHIQVRRTGRRVWSALLLGSPLLPFHSFALFPNLFFHTMLACLISLVHPESGTPILQNLYLSRVSPLEKEGVLILTSKLSRKALHLSQPYQVLSHSGPEQCDKMGAPYYVVTKVSR